LGSVTIGGYFSEKRRVHVACVKEGEGQRYAGQGGVLKGSHHPGLKRPVLVVVHANKIV